VVFPFPIVDLEISPGAIQWKLQTLTEDARGNFCYASTWTFLKDFARLINLTISTVCRFTNGINIFYKSDSILSNSPLKGLSLPANCSLSLFDWTIKKSKYRNSYKTRRKRNLK
jgi:hypothetical protein